MSDKPITFSVRVDKEAGAHTTVTIFAGENPAARGNCGQLTLRNEEVRLLRIRLNTDLQRDRDQLALDLESSRESYSALETEYVDETTAASEQQRQWREACFVHPCDCPDEPAAAIQKLRQTVEQPFVAAAAVSKLALERCQVRELPSTLRTAVERSLRLIGSAMDGRSTRA